MMWFALLLLAFLIMSIVASIWSKPPWPSRLRPRLFTVCGIVIIAWGFFFLPWVHLGLITYFDDFLVTTFLENIDILGDFFNTGIITNILSSVINGPFLNGATVSLVSLLGIRYRIAIVLAPILAAIAFVFFPFTVSYVGSTFSKIVGAIVSGGAFLDILMLIATFRYIDNLGVTHHIGLALLMALLGLHIDIGPYVTLFGLVLLFIGGLVDILGAGSQQDDSDNFSEVEQWASM